MALIRISRTFRPSETSQTRPLSFTFLSVSLSSQLTKPWRKAQWLFQASALRFFHGSPPYMVWSVPAVPHEPCTSFCHWCDLQTKNKKHYQKQRMEERIYFSLHLSGHSPPREVRAGQQELACSPWLTQLAFLYTTGLPALGWYQSQWLDPSISDSE